MPESAVEYAKGVLAATREELARADNKAALLLATAGVAIGALLAALLAGSWDPHQLYDAVEWLWWVGVVMVAGGVVALGWAILPRIRAGQPRPQMIAYFADVVATPAENLESLLEATAAAPMQSVSDQLRQVSLIVQRKYAAIRIAFLCFGGGAAACVIAVLVSSILS